ncbi:hypothetical protein HYT02_05505 [Candidatus Gottesmanbacteria bacterium]|nr:hypothetical protein [Candidatus Gottesmanbacteria bacterium]
MDKYFYLSFRNKKIFVRLSQPNLRKKYPAILFIHGASSNLHSFDLLIDQLKNRFICLTFDHLGCGQSAERFSDLTLKSRFEQAQFMLSYLLKIKNIFIDKIIIVSTSMGAHIASRLTESGKIGYRILRAPASYQKDYENVKMTSGWLPWDKSNKQWPWKPSFALEAISKYNGNLLIVESEKDEIIPGEVINEYLKQAKKVKNKKLEVIKEAPHRISDKPQFNRKFLKIVVDFIQ